MDGWLWAAAIVGWARGLRILSMILRGTTGPDDGVVGGAAEESAGGRWANVGSAGTITAGIEVGRWEASPKACEGFAVGECRPAAGTAEFSEAGSSGRAGDSDDSGSSLISFGVFVPDGLTSLLSRTPERLLSAERVRVIMRWPVRTAVVRVPFAGELAMEAGANGASSSAKISVVRWSQASSAGKMGTLVVRRDGRFRAFSSWDED
jgi:hypothetical protein